MKTENHKIARLIVTGKDYDRYDDPKIPKLVSLIERFVSETHNKQRFEFVLTAGGFLTFEFPENLQRKIDIEKAEKTLLPHLYTEAEKEIRAFFKELNKKTYKKLAEVADYFTIGIDGNNPENYQHIELIAVFDLKKEKVIHWTGKFYPTEGQKRTLIKINDLNTHFIKLGNENVVLLGCHDLTVFNARGQAAAKPDGWRRKKADEFKRLSRKFKPDIILQHPHTTFSPRIWSGGWSGVMKEFPHLKHYASGINYKITRKGNTLRPLQIVLDKTKKGDVVDFT